MGEWEIEISPGMSWLLLPCLAPLISRARRWEFKIQGFPAVSRILFLLGRNTASGPLYPHPWEGGLKVLNSQEEKRLEILGVFFLDPLAAHPEAGVPTKGTERGLTWGWAEPRVSLCLTMQSAPLFSLPLACLQMQQMEGLAD